ncbi:aminotransferase class IV [Candidatus Peregrinibacteria bacterium]|nr:aminotransferase class IV [Candidatus Peregrinibacteria bacterium]
MFVCIDGILIQAREAKISVFDHGFLYGDGVYETLRTYGSKVFQLQEHMKRLESSVRTLGMTDVFDPTKIEQWIEKTVKKNGFKESRIRVQVTRGQNGFAFGKAEKMVVVIVVERLKELDESFYKKGVDVMTVDWARCLPMVKSTSLLPMTVARQAADKADCFEAIFVENGWVKEGSISNLFMVKNGVLMTPKKGVLAGITRGLIVKLARKLGVKVKEGDFTKRKLYNADEVFITSTVKGMIPVKRVDSRKIGNGRPGSITKNLMAAFHEHATKQT